MDYPHHMSKAELLEIIKKLLKTDADLNFLLDLRNEDLRTLVASIRDRLDKAGK